MPSRKQACKFIRDVIGIRVLVAEMVFTAAAVYGMYQALRSPNEATTEKETE
jgi:hypothetical protein